MHHIYINDPFTKTGSGQTSGKHSKRERRRFLIADDNRNHDRQFVAAMVNYLDDIVGNVATALKVRYKALFCAPLSQKQHDDVSRQARDTHIESWNEEAVSLSLLRTPGCGRML